MVSAATIRPRPVATALLLAQSCHPVPCVAVTAFGTVLGVKVGNGMGTCVLLAVALLTGQLSIGWSNDRIDAARDRRAGRRDKPLADSVLGFPAVNTAIVVSVLATVGFSLALGWRAGVTHLAAVACGWAYNLGLKSTRLSWLPFALAFGALPAVATFALPAHPAPAWWLVAAAALLGVAAHLTNTVPDIEADRANGIYGAAHRLGAGGSNAVATALLAVAAVLTVLGPDDARSIGSWVILGGVLVLAAASLVVGLRHSASRVPFYGTIALVLIVLLQLVFAVPAGQFLTGLAR